MDDEKLTGFIHYLQFEKRYSAHTITAYKHDLEQFKAYLISAFESSDLVAVSHFQLRSWLASLKEEENTPKTLNRKISSLNSWYKFLKRQGITDKNPVRLLHAQKLPTRLPSYLKEKETEFLFNELTFPEGFAGSTERLICELLYATGMRRNELLNLKEADIEWSLRQIRILGKGNKERLVPVSTGLLDSMRDYLTEKRKMETYNSSVLLNLANGQPLYEGYIYRTVKKYLSSATTLKKKSPHVLRHTFATHLLNNGANIQAIKDLLGHSSLAATQIYTNNNISQLKEIHKQNHPRG